MESNSWKGISPNTENIIPPDKVIREIFSGLRGFSSNKVGFELNKVGFFPEEVTFSAPQLTLDFGSLAPKVDPHPDFGYNPQEAKSEEFFRYRLLLYPVSSYHTKYELFKFKYPILFYPVTLYVEKKSFNLLEERISEKGALEAENRAVLEDYITKIIQSESTIELISRLMAL